MVFFLAIRSSRRIFSLRFEFRGDQKRKRVQIQESSRIGGYFRNGSSVREKKQSGGQVGWILENSNSLLLASTGKKWDFKDAEKER